MSYWAEMTAPAVVAAARADAIGLWPVGATEQHGAHLATGFDAAAAAAICAAAERETEGIVVLPPLALGASEHWLSLGSTISLRPTTLVAVLEDAVRSVASAGFQGLILVNGHHGNTGPILTALGSPREDVRVEAVSYWDLVDPEELRRRCRADEGGIGHAGEVETSIALALGDLVEADPEPGAPLGNGPGSSRQRVLASPRATDLPGGVLGDPSVASPALGRWVLDSAAAALADRCRALRRELA